MRSALRRFIGSRTVPVEQAPWGEHHWCCRPGLCDTKQILMVWVTMPAGRAHQFHRHPHREEVIYVLAGEAEQWVDREKRRLRAGEAAHIPTNVVHGIYNVSRKDVTFMAVLSPAKAKGPFLVDVYRDEPWCSLKKPLDYAKMGGKR